MNELYHCPFCGGKAKLRRIRTGYRTNPPTITDEWQVECSAGCCSSKSFCDEIYHDSSGTVMVKSNGAEDAVAAWNKRI